MKTQTQDYGDITVVQIQGDLDIDSVEIFKADITEVIDAGRSGIVFDMSELGFIDSAGLEILLWVRDYCDQNKSQFRLAGLSETSHKIMEVPRLDNEFDCYDELTQAVKSFA